MKATSSTQIYKLLFQIDHFNMGGGHLENKRDELKMSLLVFIGSIDNQLYRGISLLDLWETALVSDMETHVTGDFNLDFLKWTRTDLFSYYHTHKLKPLISELFERILPHGV